MLDEGQVAERGTHDELLRKKGIYAAMWNRQREAEEAREILKQIEEEPLEGSCELKDREQRKSLAADHALTRIVVQRTLCKLNASRYMSPMSIVNSHYLGILVPIHREGYRFIAIFAAVTLVLFWLRAGRAGLAGRCSRPSGAPISSATPSG